MPLQLAARDINAMMSHAAEKISWSARDCRETSNRTALVGSATFAGGRRHSSCRFSRHLNGRDNQAEVLEPGGTPNGVKNFGGLLDKACACSPLNVCPAICRIGLPRIAVEHRRLHSRPRDSIAI
jgi:hypothetical protein